MSLRLRHVYWVIILVSIAGPSHAGPICSGFWDCLPLNLVLLSLWLAPVALLLFVISGVVWVRRKKRARPSGRLLPFVCIAAGILLVHPTWQVVGSVIIGARYQQQQRETVRNLDFATFRIDRLPAGFTIPRYGLTECVRDLYEGEIPTGIPTIDVIKAAIERPNGENWSRVFQMAAPEEGGYVTCVGGELNVHEYCYRSPSQACEVLAHTGSGIEVYRTKPYRYSSPEHLYAIIDGTLVVFTFGDELTPQDIGQSLAAIESMTRVAPSDLVSYRPDRATTGDRQIPLEGFEAEMAHIDQISFLKLLPNPLPSGFDPVQGYAHLNEYGLEFYATTSGERSKLRISFSDPTSSPQLKTCWWERACDFVAETPKNRKIYSTWTDVEGGSRSGKVREYYVDVEGTLVVLNWAHWTRSGGGDAFRSHEFSPNELETLVDSLEIVTSGDLLRFPGMRVMVNQTGAVHSAFATDPAIKAGIFDAGGSAIRVRSDCVRIDEDGSPEAMRKLQISQNGTPRRCKP